MKKEERRKNPVIAIAQIRYTDSDEKDNIKKIIKYIRLAKERNADIICFPEACIHQYNFIDFNHKLILKIREECKKNSIWCIVDDNIIHGKKIYNTAVLIDRHGKIAGHYKKIHLYGDSNGVRAGKKVKVFNTDFAKIGIAICWDIRYPRLFKKMKKKGVEIVFCPTYWAYEIRAHRARKYEEKYRRREMATLKSIIMTRAFENLFFVALCNPAKSEEEKDLVSLSMICSPHAVLNKIKDKEGLIVSKINMEEIKKLEKVYQKVI